MSEEFDVGEIRWTLFDMFQYLYHRDCMNAANLRQPVRFSPLTHRVALSLATLGLPLFMDETEREKVLEWLRAARG